MLLRLSAFVLILGYHMLTSRLQDDCNKATWSLQDEIFLNLYWTSKGFHEIVCWRIVTAVKIENMVIFKHFDVFFFNKSSFPENIYPIVYFIETRTNL